MTRFGMRLIFGGIPAAVIGIIWFAIGVSGSDLDDVLPGGVWKGPLLACAGIGAVVMGMRMLREQNSEREE